MVLPIWLHYFNMKNPKFKKMLVAHYEIFAMENGTMRIRFDSNDKEDLKNKNIFLLYID